MKRTHLNFLLPVPLLDELSVALLHVLLLPLDDALPLQQAAVVSSLGLVVGLHNALAQLNIIHLNVGLIICSSITKTTYLKIQFEHFDVIFTM